MAIRDMQTNLTEVGRIRLGLAPHTTDNPDKYPARLETFRFTSPNEHLIQGLAELYGGQSRRWTPQGGGRQQFEVITTESRIQVYVPRQAIDPWYEQWGNGVCTRRCDGETDIIHDQPCTCPVNDRQCKMVVRLNLMLAELVGTGVWRLESHGFYATSEISALAPMIQQTQMPLPGILMLDQRERKYFDREKGKPQVKKYHVPVVLFDTITARALMGGAQAIHAALTGQAQAQQVEAPQQRAAITQTAQHGNGGSRPAVRTAGPTTQDPWADALPANGGNTGPTHEDNLLRSIGRAETREQMETLRDSIEKIGRPERLTKAWSARAREIIAAAEQQPSHPMTTRPETRQQAETSTGQQVVDVELPTQAPTLADDEPEPDRAAALMSLMAEGQKRGYDTSTKIEALATRHIGKSTNQADGWELEALRDLVRSGRV
jgi:hypothetical protein